MKHSLTRLLATLTLCLPVISGAKTGSMKVDHYCSFNAESLPSILTTFGSDNAAEQAVKRIMSYTGLPSRFEILAANVPNAAAVFRNNKRYILYNQHFMRKVRDTTRNNWSEISILAHEIGHHLSNHTFVSLGSRPKFELEADRFAGFVLQKMGASLDDAVVVMERMASEQGSRTHPPRSARVVAVTNGWVDAGGKHLPERPLSPEPKPKPAQPVVVSHNHNGQEHRHPLPATGLNHQHTISCHRERYEFSKGCINWSPTRRIVIDGVTAQISGSESGREIRIMGYRSFLSIFRTHDPKRINYINHIYSLIKKTLEAENITITKVIPVNVNDPNFSRLYLELGSDGYKKLVKYSAR